MRSALAFIRTMTLFLPLVAHGQSIISAKEAKSHIGENATVCGKVAGSRYLGRSQEDPIFINIDKPYSEQVFKVVIWGRDLAKFKNPEQDYLGKRICVMGEITQFRGVPQIVATDPSQIRIP